MELTNKKILILGMAKSGYAAAKVLARTNQVIVNDSNKNQPPKQIEKLKTLGVKVVLGAHPDKLFDQTYDYLIKNPGIPLNHKYIQKAYQFKIPVINEIEVAYHFLPKDIFIIGITGTNGKTTTATLIYKILKKANLPVHLTGNIGTPLCDFIRKIKKGDIVIIELSIQQLLNISSFKTNLSVLTNLSEAHLDFISDYHDYIKGKLGVFNKHAYQEVAILNGDDINVVNNAIKIQSMKKYFSSQRKADCYLADGIIYYRQNPVITVSDIKISGIHNYENVMAAILVVKELKIKNAAIRQVLKEFKGIEHRVEYVDVIKGIEIYNDSKATNIKSTQTALKLFNKPIILLLGGLDRGQNFYDLTPYLNNVKLLIGYGACKGRIKEYAGKIKWPSKIVSTLKDALKIGIQQGKEGDIILLSPASASLDQFKNMAERGQKFKEYVKEIKEE